MAEEKTKKKKLVIVWQILKWFGLALLALLLIASIIFQAPWKVITLLAIVLLACTALPKPARKWFWLSVGAIVIALIIWVFLPEDNEGWKQYKYNFDKEIAAMEAARAIPDEENAATIYNQLLESYVPNTLDPLASVSTDVYDSMYRGPWSGENYPNAAAWLKEHQGTIATLIKASGFEKCRFPISSPANIEKQLDRNSVIRRWAQLLVIATNNDIAEGRTDQTLEKSVALLKIASHLYQQPTPLDLLGGMASETLVMGQFKRFIIDGDATEAHLSAIEKALSGTKCNWSSVLTNTLEYQKLSATTERAKYYQINQKGRIRLSRDPLAQLRARAREALPLGPIEYEQLRVYYERLAYPSYLEKKLIKAGTICRWFYIPANPQKAAQLIDSGYEKYYAMAKPDFDWKKGLEQPSSKFNYTYLTERLAGISGRIYYSVHDLYLRLIANKRGSQLLIGLRRYKNKNGRWPEDLDDIKSLAPEEIFVDPINDNSFVYKLTEENFTLYSKGKNNIDENGEYNSTWDPNSFESKVEEDDRLIWPPWTTKAKEENTDAEQQ